MPKKAKTKSAKPKSKSRRGPLQTSRSLTMIKQVPFLGIRHWSRNMPYHETYQLTTGINPEVAAFISFALNGMYDEEVAAGGHQPMGFDQAMSFYEHYTVTEVAWTVTFLVNSGATLGGSTNYGIGYTITPDAAGITAVDAIVENGLMKRSLITSNSANSNNRATFSGKLNLAKYFGKDILNEDDYRGNVGANPVEMVYLELFAHSLSSSSTVTFDVDVTLDITALFTEPKKQVQS